VIYIILSAYEILGDPGKRKQYDQFGDAAFGSGGGGGNSGAGDFSFKFDDFFKGFDDAFGAHRSGRRSDRTFNFGHPERGGSFFSFNDLFDDDDSVDDGFGNMFSGFNTFSSSFSDDIDDGFQTVTTHSHSYSHSSSHSGEILTVQYYSFYEDCGQLLQDE